MLDTYLHTYKPYSQNNEGEPATDLASRNEAVILLEEEAEVDPENLPESEGVSHESLLHSQCFLSWPFEMIKTHKFSLMCASFPTQFKNLSETLPKMCYLKQSRSDSPKLF